MCLGGRGGRTNDNMVKAKTKPKTKPKTKTKARKGHAFLPKFAGSSNEEEIQRRVAKQVAALASRARFKEAMQSGGFESDYYEGRGKNGRRRRRSYYASRAETRLRRLIGGSTARRNIIPDAPSSVGVAK